MTQRGIRSGSPGQRATSTFCIARRCGFPFVLVPRWSRRCTTSRFCAIPRRSHGGIATRASSPSARPSARRTRSSPSRRSRATSSATVLGVPADRVRVIGNGVDPVFTTDGPAEDGDYVLAVGTLEPRKNLARAVEAGRLAGRRGARRRRDRLGWRRRSGVGGPRRRRGARSALPRRAVPRLPLAVRGVRDSDPRGDGVRDAGRDEQRAERRRRSREGPPFSSIRSTSRRSLPASSSTQARRSELVATRSRASRRHSRGSVPRTRSSALAGARMSRASRRRRRRRARPEPHRRREVRSQPPSRAARARRGGGPQDRGGDAAPRARSRRHRADRARHAEPGAANGMARFRDSCDGSGAALVHTQYALPLRSPCPAVVTIHDLSFERDSTLMGRRDRRVFRFVVPRAAHGCSRRPHRLRAIEAGHRRALRHTGRADRRDAEHRRSGVRAGSRGEP